MLKELATEGIRWFMRRYPYFPGRGRVQHWLRGLSPHIFCREPTEVQTLGGQWMRVDPVDFDGWQIFLNGCLEPWSTRLFKALIRPEDCVLDIGANIGYFTLLAAALVGSEGCVHAFEPNADAASELTRNVERNGFENVMVHQQAVSSDCGTVEFHCARRHHTGVSSIRDLGALTDSTVTVRAVSIDSMLEELPRVKLVKIDVEGAEFLVLKGMCRLLHRDEPYVMAELTDRWIRQVGGDVAGVLDNLRGFGYAVYRIVFDRLRPMEGVFPKQCDVLCVPADKPVPDITDVPLSGGDSS